MDDGTWTIQQRYVQTFDIKLTPLNGHIQHVHTYSRYRTHISYKKHNFKLKSIIYTSFFYFQTFLCFFLLLHAGMTSRRKWGLTLLLQKMLPGCSVHCHLTRREKNKLRLDESHTNDCLTTIGRKEVFNKVFYAIFYLHILQLFIAMKLSTYTDVWLWSGNRETIYWTKFTANLENRLFLCISWHGHGGIMLYA